MTTNLLAQTGLFTTTQLLTGTFAIPIESSVLIALSGYQHLHAFGDSCNAGDI